MKFYRLSIRTENGHEGYRYFSNKKEMITYRKKRIEEDEVESKMKEMNVKPTLKSFLQFLNTWASYPDNG